MTHRSAEAGPAATATGGRAPLVAIAMPVHNGAQFLEEALLSFQQQAYPHFEMIICDNASMDSTPEIAQRFSRSDKRFIYTRQSDFLNAKDSFIRAYRLTNREHKYFLWACDDNVWHPQFLSETVSYLEANPGCSLCSVFLHHFGGSHEVAFHQPMPQSFGRSRLLQFILERSSVSSIYGLMRRNAIDSIELELDGIRDYPDRYYLLQLRGHGYFHVVEKDLLGFRAGGISSTGDDPWVRTVIDTNFGEGEFDLLFKLPQISLLDKIVLSLKFTYIALRHNIPSTVYRFWLSPAYVLASAVGLFRPSQWRVTGQGLQKQVK